MTGSEWHYNHSPLLELQSAGSQIRAVAFSANGEYLVSTHCEMVEAWRIKNGAQMATMTARCINCLATSQDGRWIVAGTKKGVFVWDASTFKQVFTLEEEDVIGIDVAPDSTRLLVASDVGPGTATVWDILTQERVLSLHHDHQWVRAAKYSPQGDRIATATPYTVRVWDSNSDSLLVVISVEVTPWYNTGLLWFNNHLFVISDNTIKQLKASTGEKISEWPVEGTNSTSSITVPLHREFIAYSTNRAVTFLDTLKQTQLGIINHTQDICSIALSRDDQFIAIAGKNGKINIQSLSPIIDLIPLSRLHPTFREPDIRIDDAVFNSWIHDELESAESLLTAAIPTALSSGHHHDMLASRALIRARLGQLDTALIDAKQSIKSRPSAIGYIAKSTVLARMGKRHKAYRTCDIAFERFHSDHVSFLILTKAIIVFMVGEHADAISRLDDLIGTVRFKSMCYMVQAHMYLLLGNSQIERNDYKGAIQSYEHARANLRDHTSRPLLMISLISGWKFDELAINIQQRLCEALRAVGRRKDACQSFFDLVNNFNEMVYTKQSVTKWISYFTHQCLSASDRISDIPYKASTYDDIAPTTPASLNSISAPLLREWARATLASISWKDALASAANFMVPPCLVYRTLCERLEEMECTMDAIECFCQMVDALEGQTDMEQAEWVLDFKCRCSGKLEHLGDLAMKSGQHDDAVSYYSAALSLPPTTPQDLFIKRSKAYVSSGLWKDALNDANLVIMLDPTSPWGYERKHAALHEAGDYENAIDAYKAMLSNMLRSPDQEIRELQSQYVNPGDTEAAIHKAVLDAIRDSPRVLINTISGRLVNKSGQAAAFKSLPIYKELISSMTTSLDHSLIVQHVTHYYRYAMFSHKWEANEPLFQSVAHIVVYSLDSTPTHHKLKMFCKIVRDAGLHWAWSDTCCINQANHIVLQEALVAMFRWYQGSTVTIIFLRGVRSPGGLPGSIWNTRAWTLQEYHASKVVRFYNEDWTLYMNLDIPNHKDSPEIISEMEQATAISAQTLMELRPGSTNIREKLRLASKRDTSRVEDAAYSLLGIFSMTMSVVYGEKDKSLGRLLAQLLTNSGDTSILAWTGRSGHFNSCLPAEISVFSQLSTAHIPSVSEDAPLDGISARLSGTSLNFTLATRFYDRLHEHPLPLFVGQRMKLPCITFKLERISTVGSGPRRIFRAHTAALGIVHIRAKENLSRLGSLCLVHPWIDFLLERQPINTATGKDLEDSTESQFSLVNLPDPSNTTSSVARQNRSTNTNLLARFGHQFGTWPRVSGASSYPPRPSMSLTEKQIRALRLIARLKQPFGALLLAQNRQNVEEYKRVAAESTIQVQLQEDVPLSELMDSVRVLDVV